MVGSATGTHVHDFATAIGPEAAQALRERGQRCSFPRGRPLVYEGQVPDRVLWIQRGSVKVGVFTVSGREALLAFRGPGELVGEQSAIDGEPRSATVVTVAPVEALAFTHTAFRSFLLARPDVALELAALLSRRLREADARRLEFAGLSSTGRVAAMLVEFSARFGREDNSGIRIALPLSQEELASCTATSLESVGRALQIMRGLNYIETGRREIHVVDLPALERLGRGEVPAARPRVGS
ncbi:Crp/Fnr family transcriptional regulator [Solirubrobacter ginsenosidimutans]|uniref:Crp/Fnr family transcriptional regulator n=1 Tax=Solirubrobacter ginsenosidimutans TaxID=490573 RepID=A0A9X3N4T2_9ACTN|nr:Crp/Fnr family transcriptional regulator [Solirubrobacter ginsenosidimutans]MDA0167088.1 Crp/Fnr family transcriptional regulator [Solirubrobacter ginsenosidimutans]